MCGIFCTVIFSGRKDIMIDKRILQRINNRGPDCVQNLHLSLHNKVDIHFRGSVLWMQGPELTSQPLESECGVLLYNGDIFDETWDKNFSDTLLIMRKLNQADTYDRKEHILQVLKTLKGPFSLIYYDKATHDLYCLRDRIGRSSLLLHKNEDYFVISSVLGRDCKCVELPATFIHIINLETLQIELHSWNSSLVQDCDLTTWFSDLTTKQNLPDEDYAFEFDRETDLNYQDDVIEFIDNVVKEPKSKLSTFEDILKHSVIHNTVQQLTQLLDKSLKIRLETQPNQCKECLNTNLKCNHCTVGILFSGGLDCTILAFLADKFVPADQPIDLINVAFKKDNNSSYDVPDRITGKQSFQELQRLCSTRKWVFKEINVPKEEVDELQKSTIADLVFPRQTILDESLGTALWFAARGKENNSSSSCRILILGSGADELFGGYSRHKNAFKYHGWPGLNKELVLDWKRISFRNLARDNRVICDHGRQPRMPYLDEDFTKYVLNLKPWLRCYPSESLGPGVGDKLMLRLLAYNLGLTGVSTFPKRALQFGSRIANKKEKGSDISKNFEV